LPHHDKPPKTAILFYFKRKKNAGSGTFLSHIQLPVNIPKERKVIPDPIDDAKQRLIR
jgi:hypothetical protein